MCRIVAMFSNDRPISPQALKRATAALHHRGPDGQRQWISANGRTGLGHARLSIIDLATGDQPIANEDGSVVVVDGYTRTPILDWARTSLPQYRLKAPKPSGTGAPVGRSAGGDLPAGQKNPFHKDSFNLTEQARLVRNDPDLANRLRQAAKQTA